MKDDQFVFIQSLIFILIVLIMFVLVLEYRSSKQSNKLKHDHQRLLLNYIK